MPSEAEIFSAVHGSIPADQTAPRVSGAILDLDRWRFLKERAQRAASVYRPLRFPPMRAIQAPTPRPRTALTTVFCECGSEASAIPPSLFQCKRPSCRRLWAAK